MPAVPMLSTRLLSNPSTRVDGLRKLLPALGWPASAQLPAFGDDVFEVLAGGEPRVLFAGALGASRAVSLAYTREAPYIVAFSDDHAYLYASRCWDRVAGDSPLATASVDERVAIGELLELVRRDRVLVDAPSDLAVAGTNHRPLHDVLGLALRRLRAQVAEVDAYRSGASRDTAVLRLFHQILYVRVIEDRKLPTTGRSIRDILIDANPAGSLAELLSQYAKTLDSELFAWAGIEVAELPSVPLLEVLRATVEPWDALRLDFSVSRTELASRLYESYLRDLPVRRSAKESGRLFDIAEVVDERERQATFYTPPALAGLVASDALSRYLKLSESTEDMRILDPACGSGAFLVAAYRHLRMTYEKRLGRALRSGERESLLVNSIYGADVDERALGIARVQLLEEAELKGRRLPSLAENLFVGDALRSPPGIPHVDGAVPWDVLVEKGGLFDCVLTNPPFGAQAKLPTRLSVTDIREITSLYPEVGAFGQDLAYLFVALARRLAHERATAGFVLPRPLLNQSAGRGARELLAKWGVATLHDFRGAKIFPRIAASVCTVVVDPFARSTQVTGLVDSRVSPEEALDALASRRVEEVTHLRQRSTALGKAAINSWTPFRLRWDELRAEFDQRLGCFGDDARRVVRTGTKPARVRNFVVPQTQWRWKGERLEVDGLSISPENLPEFVRSGDLKPFQLTPSGDRLLLPFDRSGDLSNDPDLDLLVARRGGIPANFQRGELSVLLGPKILLSGVSKEPAAVADISGTFVPMMRGVHALRIDDIPHTMLPAVAAMLQSAFYQWLLRGFGAPRADETVEVTTKMISELPWPTLSDSVLAKLNGLGRDVQEALNEPGDVRRIGLFDASRAILDEFVFDCVGAGERLRGIVRSELIRIG